MTPTLSVEAVQATVTEFDVVPVACRPLGAVGACVSAGGGHGPVEAVIVPLAERLPAASYASTASVYAVPQARPLNDALVEAVDPVDVPLR